MKKIVAFPIIVLLGVFWGCLDKQGEDKLVAKVGAENIYASDVDFLKRIQPKPYATPGQEKAALENIIESLVIFQETKQLIGEDSVIENRIRDLEDRFWAQAYGDFFLTQNLGFSDERLQDFFQKNRKIFLADSCKSVDNCRERVAKALLISENADSLKRYVKKQLLDAQSAKVELAYVEASDSSSVRKAEEDLRAQKISLEQIPGLKREEFLSKMPRGILEIDSVYHLLFGKDSLAVGEIRFVRGSQSFVVFKVLLRRAPRDLPEDKQDSILQANFASDWAAFLVSKNDSVLESKYRLRYEPIITSEIRKYYEAHKDSFGDSPIDSVARQIENTLFKNAEVELDSDYVLATVGGKPLVLEKDVQKLKLEMPERFRIQYPRRRCVMMLAGWKMKALAAKEQGLDNDGLVRRIRESVRRSFYRNAFAGRLAELGFFASEATMRSIYERIGTRLYPNRDFASIRGELGIFAQTHDREFLYEYYLLYPNSEVTDLDSIKLAVFPQKTTIFSRNWFENYRRDLYKKYPVQIEDPAYLPRADLFSTQNLMLIADTMYQNQNLVGAYITWKRIMSLSSSDDSLFARAAYELAELDLEREKYKEADAEFAAYLRLWPQSALAEKSLFSRAFLLHEYLKNDSLALPLFLQFQQKYPKSEMIESVNWLVKDIQSGGKLGEELLQKISEQEE